mmetsp:Transcript_119381/g.363216  ORF Transcript_119381/g.363216 Transcript_119381/m.363216 type:complete len:224 (-) Transcript_119381:110-781(-)
MAMMDRLPSSSHASFTGEAKLIVGLVVELVGKVSACCGSEGMGLGRTRAWLSTFSCEKCCRTMPPKSSCGMSLLSQVKTQPASAGSFFAHSEALPSCRTESQTTIMQAGRLFPPCCCRRTCTHGCASRQSVMSTNGGRGALWSHRENWLAFLRQTSAPPWSARPWCSSRQRSSFSLLWQRSWHHTSRHQPFEWGRNAPGCHACPHAGAPPGRPIPRDGCCHGA